MLLPRLQGLQGAEPATMPPTMRLLVRLCRLALYGYALSIAITGNPVLGALVAVPALQGDWKDEGRTGASVEGVVCVEVLPEALIALAQEAAAISAAGESVICWQVGYRR
jgi:hypothetical protein